MECPVCEYPATELQYRLCDRLVGSRDERFDLYRCPNCGAISQEQMTISGRIGEFYPEAYWWDDSGRLSGLEKFYREQVVKYDHLRFLRSVVPEPGKRRLLDIGCGSAVFLKLAREAGYNAFGLDSSARAASLAAKEVPDKVFCGTEEDLITAGESFDILTLFHVLEHVPDPFKYLRRLRRLVRRPGGVLIQVPNLASCQARWFGSRWYGLDCPRHVCNFTLSSLLHLLGRCGYRIERVRHFSLRDNAAAIVSSLLPRLDPIAQRIRKGERMNRIHPVWTEMSELLYFALVVTAQPLAWGEARLGRGGTITVYSTLA